MDIQSTLQYARTAAQQQDMPIARAYVKAILQQDPKNLEAWLLAGQVMATPEESVRCYRCALQIDPANNIARAKLAQLQAAAVQPETPEENKAAESRPLPLERPASSASSVRRGLVGLVTVVMALACLLGLGGWAVSSGTITSSMFAIPTPTDDVLFAVLDRNANALTSRSITACMETIHPLSPGYPSFEKFYNDLFSEVNMWVKYYNLNVIYKDAKEARINFSMIIRIYGRSEYGDTVFTGVVTLRAYYDEWKIYDQDFQSSSLAP